VYAFHVLVGHHGIFSLTPLWLLTLAGCWWGLRSWHRPEERLVLLAIVVVSVICIAFYILRPQADRSYGGMTCCFRWALWLIPLWFYGMVPALERLASTKWGRGLALFLAAASAMSAAYPTWNPWTHPWLYQWLESAGWISY
jgi:F0F1-type ATP synthase assembly protein I